MTYTILFVDNACRTAAIIVIAYEKGDTSPSIIRHANQKHIQYEKAYLLGQDGFEGEPFYVRQESDWKNQEVHQALSFLQDRIDRERASAGPECDRKAE